MQIFIEQQNNRHSRFKQEAMFSGPHSQNHALEEIEKKEHCSKERIPDSQACPGVSP